MSLTTQPFAKTPTCSSCTGGNYPAGFFDAKNCPKNNVCNVIFCDSSVLVRLVISIIQLGASDGSSTSEILTQHNANVSAGDCSENTLTLEEVEKQLGIGYRKGVFSKLTGDLYKVYGFFADLPSNHDLRKELGSNYQTCLGMFCRE